MSYGCVRSIRSGIIDEIKRELRRKPCTLPRSLRSALIHPSIRASVFGLTQLVQVARSSIARERFLACSTRFIAAPNKRSTSPPHHSPGFIHFAYDPTYCISCLAPGFWLTSNRSYRIAKAPGIRTVAWCWRCDNVGVCDRWFKPFEVLVHGDLDGTYLTIGAWAIGRVSRKQQTLASKCNISNRLPSCLLVWLGRSLRLRSTLAYLGENWSRALRTFFP